MSGVLDDCGCCAGVAQSTPAAVSNRPGLSALLMRVGTWDSFLRSMLAALSGEDRPALAALSARGGGDWTIALLDAFAVAADVLTFYQERYAQENWLRTATERRSLLELARLIGYELNPGVAAQTPLAFTLDATATPLDLPPGTKAQSIPGPGQTAQTFETVEDITARPEFSALAARLTEVHWPRAGDERLWLSGGALNLKTGDLLLVVGGEKQDNPAGSDAWDCVRVASVDVDSANALTTVTLHRKLRGELGAAPTAPPLVFALRRQASLFGYNAPRWRTLSVAQRVGEVDPHDHTKVIAGPYVGRQNTWVERAFAATRNAIDLDAIYQPVTRDGWIVLTAPGRDPGQAYRVSSVVEANQADFTLTARATRLGIQGRHIEWFSRRNATAFVQSEALALAERPVADPLPRGHAVLARLVNGLKPDHPLIVAGKRVRVEVPETITALELTRDDGSARPIAPGEQFIVLELGPLAFHVRSFRLRALDGDVGTIHAAPFQLPFVAAAKDDPVLADFVLAGTVEEADATHTRIQFSTQLTNWYDRASVTIYANVALATQGETVQEVLGSGDASASFLSFPLRQNPLTYVQAATPTGARSTLRVFANDTEWTEADTLYGEGASARVFALRRDDAGTTTVRFGDGVLYGARPPSGSANLRAKYRKGIGLGGNVDAGQITTLLSRPLGLKAVVNPLPASGGADPEPLKSARANASLSVATLGRAVSLQDYEDFARGFAGIAKAQAGWRWEDGERRVVLTLAGTDGAEVKPDGTVAGYLAAALTRFGDPTVPLALQSYKPLTFQLGLRVRASSDDIQKRVRADVEDALRGAFGFAARGFVQAVALSDVTTVAQGVAGVVAVQVTRLYLTGDPPTRQIRLAGPAGVAWLLTLDPSKLVELGDLP